MPGACNGLGKRLSPSPSLRALPKNVSGSEPKAQAQARPGSACAPKGDVALCIRLRPGQRGEVCAAVDSCDSVRLRACGGAMGGTRNDPSEAVFCGDHAFGPEASQEQVYAQAVAPIAEAVIGGYNGAVIAYGQTGAGKTYTMIGKGGQSEGMAPRAISAIFASLMRRDSWKVEISVLEIYNERVWDLLTPGNAVASVEIHEVQRDDRPGQSFRCPDATLRPVTTPDEALTALAEGVRRRETAPTDLNHHSSRSHLVVTVCVEQRDAKAGAVLHSRLNLVDLAGSERLKRSLGSGEPPRRSSASPRPMRLAARVLSSVVRRSSAQGRRDPCRETREINRSLSQLALVIQRLTAPGAPQYVPYRDSVVTRLLAESFGGSSKTCLVINCSPLSENREETRGSLEFGRRAKLVQNKPQINVEVESDTSSVLKAMQVECEKLRGERNALLLENARLQAAANSARWLGQQPAPGAAAGALHADAAPEEAAGHHFQLALEASEHAFGGRVSSLVEELAALRCSGERAAEEPSQVQSTQAEALASLEEKLRALRNNWQGVARLGQESVAAMRKAEEEKAVLQRQLREAIGDATQLQDGRAAMALQLQDDRSKIVRRWQEETQAVREEKAAAVAALEEEKMTLHRKWKEEVGQLHEARASTMAEAESEKAALRRNLQEALEEVRRLQAQQASLERKLDAEKPKLSAALDVEKVSSHKQMQVKKL